MYDLAMFYLLTGMSWAASSLWLVSPSEEALVQLRALYKTNRHVAVQRLITALVLWVLFWPLIAALIIMQRKST